MKFQQLYSLLSEAVTPVQSYTTAYKTIVKKMKDVKKNYEELIKKVLDKQDYIINDISAIGLDYYFVEKIKNLKNRQIDEEGYYDTVGKTIRTIEHDLNVAKDTEDGHFRYEILTNYIPAEIKRFIKHQDPEKDNYSLQYVENSLQEFNSRSEEYGFEENEINFGKDLEKYIVNIKRILDEIRYYDLKITTLTNWNYGEYRDSRKFRPEDLQPIEIAYHASIRAKELFQNGFQEKYSGPELGLGGSSYEGHVSFSLSLDICKTIASTLKEMWMIVHGKWSRESVIDYVKKYTETPENFKSAVDSYLRKKSTSKFPPDNKADLIEFYLTSLWFIKSPVSKNPVFMNTNGKEWIKKLENVDYNDIGIIKAKIKTENASEFLVAEREIRIPPKDVVEMISIIQ